MPVPSSDCWGPVAAQILEGPAAQEQPVGLATLPVQLRE